MFRKRAPVLIALILTAVALTSVGYQLLNWTTANAADDAVNEDANVSVAHYAPFAADLSGTSVSVLVNGAEAITDFEFGDRVEDIPLASGTYTIEIVPTGSVTPALTSVVTVTAGQDYTLAAIGDGSGWPLELWATADSPPVTMTKGIVRITHLAPFANTLDGTKVDICTDDGAALPGLTNVPYKVSSGYLELEPGVYDLNIAVAGTDCGSVALDIPPFTLKAGQIADVYAIGLLSDGDLGLQVSQRGLVAGLSVAHLASFADTVNGTSVSVKLDGADVLTDVVFSNISPYLTVDPGEYEVTIVPTGADSAAISGTAVISGFQDFSFAAIGDVVNQPLELVRFVDDNATVPSSGSARVRIAHFAAVSSDLQSTRVDLCDATSESALLTNFEYKQDVTLELTTGVYDLYLSAAGTSCASPLIDIPAFVLSDGDIVYIYAAGDIVNLPPVVLSAPQLALAARVKVAHFAPFASTIESTAVTVKLDGSDIITGFVYPQMTGYLNLPGGSYNVSIYPEGVAASATPAISGTITISEGMDYTAAAIGDGTNQSLGLKLFTDDTPPAAAGKGKIRAAHLAPFAPIIADTAVELCAAEGSAPLIPDFRYEESETLELDEGIYTTVFIGSGNCSVVVLPIPPFVVANETPGFVYALGGANGLPLTVVATPDSILAQTVNLPTLFAQNP